MIITNMIITQIQV